MAPLANGAILLALACVSHQLTVGAAHGDRREDKPGPAALPMKGKWVTGDKSECTWAATGEGLVIVAVSCEKGDERFGCEYVGRPTACPRYDDAADAKLFRRQLARALRKRDDLCRGGGGGGGGAPVRVGACGGACGGDARFRLRGGGGGGGGAPTTRRRTRRPAAGGVKSCRPRHERRAGEHCGDSWSSVCTFLFTVLQDRDCS